VFIIFDFWLVGEYPGARASGFCLVVVAAGEFRFALISSSVNFLANPFSIRISARLLLSVTTSAMREKSLPRFMFSSVTVLDFDRCAVRNFIACI